MLYFDDHKVVLIRADEKAREMISRRVKHGYTLRPQQEGEDERAHRGLPTTDLEYLGGFERKPISFLNADGF